MNTSKCDGQITSRKPRAADPVASSDGVYVRRYLSAVLILGILDFAIGFKVDNSPPTKFRGILHKSEVNHALYERAVLAKVLEGCFASQGFGFRRSLDEGMSKGGSRIG